MHMKEPIDLFTSLVEESSLDSTDKVHIRHFVNFAYGSIDPILSSRVYAFIGNAGVGKTYLSQELLKLLKTNILYISSIALPIPHSRRCFSFQEVLKYVAQGKRQVLYLDDLNFLIENDEVGNITSTCARDIMSILDMVRNDSSKLLLISMNDINALQEQMMDRVEVKIFFDLPSDSHKKKFLESSFGKYVTGEFAEYIAKNSIGYNYRDLVELVKTSYRTGKNAFTLENIQTCLKQYKPTQLQGFEIHRDINAKLEEVSGKKEQLKILRRVVKLYKEGDSTNISKVQRYNLLLFHGPPGSGKTHTVRALAGELGYPLISLKEKHLYDRHGMDRIEPILGLAKRYRNCILFIDEADKLIGNPSRYGEDTRLMGTFNSVVSGLGKDVKGIVILAVNDIGRFGDAFIDRFVPVKFELPTYEERVSFCEEKKKETNITTNVQEIARDTKGLSYRDLQKVWNELLFQQEEKEPDTNIQNIIRELQKEEETGMCG